VSRAGNALHSRRLMASQLLKGAAVWLANNVLLLTSLLRCVPVRLMTDEAALGGAVLMSIVISIALYCAAVNRSSLIKRFPLPSRNDMLTAVVRHVVLAPNFLSIAGSVWVAGTAAVFDSSFTRADFGFNVPPEALGDRLSSLGLPFTGGFVSRAYEDHWWLLALVVPALVGYILSPFVLTGRPTGQIPHRKLPLMARLETLGWSMFMLRPQEALARARFHPAALSAARLAIVGIGVLFLESSAEWVETLMAVAFWGVGLTGMLVDATGVFQGREFAKLLKWSAWVAAGMGGGAMRVYPMLYACGMRFADALVLMIKVAPLPVLAVGLIPMLISDAVSSRMENGWLPRTPWLKYILILFLEIFLCAWAVASGESLAARILYHGATFEQDYPTVVVPLPFPWTIAFLLVVTIGEYEALSSMWGTISPLYRLTPFNDFHWKNIQVVNTSVPILLRFDEDKRLVRAGKGVDDETMEKATVWGWEKLVAPLLGKLGIAVPVRPNTEETGATTLLDSVDDISMMFLQATDIFTRLEDFRNALRTGVVSVECLINCTAEVNQVETVIDALALEGSLELKDGSRKPLLEVRTIPASEVEPLMRHLAGESDHQKVWSSRCTNLCGDGEAARFPCKPGEEQTRVLGVRIHVHVESLQWLFSQILERQTAWLAGTAPQSVAVVVRGFSTEMPEWLHLLSIPVLVDSGAAPGPSHETPSLLASLGSMVPSLVMALKTGVSDQVETAEAEAASVLTKHRKLERQLYVLRSMSRERTELQAKLQSLQKELEKSLSLLDGSRQGRSSHRLGPLLRQLTSMFALALAFKQACVFGDSVRSLSDADSVELASTVDRFVRRYMTEVVCAAVEIMAIVGIHTAWGPTPLGSHEEGTMATLKLGMAVLVLSTIAFDPTGKYWSSVESLFVHKPTAGAVAAGAASVVATEEPVCAESSLHSRRANDSLTE
jgi:hypothetical protein